MGKGGERVAITLYHRPTSYRRSVANGGKGERTSLTHEVRQSQVIPTLTLSVTGPPVPSDVILQLSLVLAVVAVTA